MKAALLAFAALAACGSMPSAQRTASFPLANADFEQRPAVAGDCAPGWGCSSHADPASFRFFTGPGAPGGGTASLCIEPVKHEPWARVAQSRFDPALRGRHLRFSIDARLEGVTGSGAGALVVAHDGHGGTIASRRSLLTGTRDWGSLFVDFEVPAAAAEVEVGAILEGRGRLCIDNAHVEVLP
ncbi:MAG TPA: hypothetical protein VN782_03325 [Usitatibacter sp.]|nr:hypothetical protein [Usitatibacter sp.]